MVHLTRNMQQYYFTILGTRTLYTYSNGSDTLTPIRVPNPKTLFELNLKLEPNLGKQTKMLTRSLQNNFRRHVLNALQPKTHPKPKFKEIPNFNTILKYNRPLYISNINFM